METLYKFQLPGLKVKFREKCIADKSRIKNRENNCSICIQKKIKIFKDVFEYADIGN